MNKTKNAPKRDQEGHFIGDNIDRKQISVDLRDNFNPPEGMPRNSGRRMIHQQSTPNRQTVSLRESIRLSGDRFYL
jgi:hypothetical protein